MRQIHSQIRTVGRVVDSRIKVLLAIFTHDEREGWVHPNLAYWIASVIDSQRYRIIVSPVHNVQPKSAARNAAVAIALNHNADYLMMIDNDVAPDPELLHIFDDLTIAHDVISPIVYRWHKAHGSVPDFADRRWPDQAELDKILAQIPESPERFKIVEQVKHDFERLPQFEPHKEIEPKILEVTGHVCGGCMILHNRAFKGTGVRIPGSPETAIFHELRDKNGAFIVQSHVSFCVDWHGKGKKLFVDPRFICGSYGTQDLAQVNFCYAQIINLATGQPTEERVKEIAREAAAELTAKTPPETEAAAATAE